MSTPYDAIPPEVRRANWGWFGPPWPSGVCYDDDGRLMTEMEKEFPAGEDCLYCEEAFQEGDSGQAMPCHTTEGSMIRHAHKECLFRNVVGGLAHLEHRCMCYGGTDYESGMSKREEALEVWRRYTAKSMS